LNNIIYLAPGAPQVIRALWALQSTRSTGRLRAWFFTVCVRDLYGIPIGAMQCPTRNIQTKKKRQAIGWA
jgi:hypothetical protein